MMHSAETLREIRLLVSATAVPMLVVDYTPIIERYRHCSAERVAQLLQDDEEFLECVVLPRNLGASREWSRLFGVSDTSQSPDLAARDFSIAEYPELRRALVTQFVAPFTGETSITSEHLAPTVDGHVVVRSHWKASMNEGKPDYSRIVIVDVDVTDLRETERSLEATLSSKERLVASISHELRNPIAAGLGFSSILASDWDSLDEGARRDMAVDIHEQMGDVSAIVEDLLALYGGAERGIADEVVSICDVLDGVDCGSLECELEAGAAVRGDRLRIRQIVRNLVRNCLRHGGQERRLVAASGAGKVVISVADSGPGVPNAIRERMFEPFAHGGASGSLGLGLAVARDLARAMGGDLRYSRSDGWTRFDLVLRQAG